MDWCAGLLRAASCGNQQVSHTLLDYWGNARFDTVHAPGFCGAESHNGRAPGQKVSKWNPLDRLVCASLSRNAWAVDNMKALYFGHTDWES